MTRGSAAAPAAQRLKLTGNSCVPLNGTLVLNMSCESTFQKLLLDNRNMDDFLLNIGLENFCQKVDDDGSPMRLPWANLKRRYCPFTEPEVRRGRKHIPRRRLVGLSRVRITIMISDLKVLADCDSLARVYALTVRSHSKIRGTLAPWLQGLKKKLIKTSLSFS